MVASTYVFFPRYITCIVLRHLYDKNIKVHLSLLTWNFCGRFVTEMFLRNGYEQTLSGIYKVGRFEIEKRMYDICVKACVYMNTVCSLYLDIVTAIQKIISILSLVNRPSGMFSWRERNRPIHHASPVADGQASSCASTCKSNSTLIYISKIQARQTMPSNPRAAHPLVVSCKFNFQCACI